MNAFHPNHSAARHRSPAAPAERAHPSCGVRRPAAARCRPALVVFPLLLLFIGAVQPGAQETAEPLEAVTAELLPAQQPFDLNLHNARMAKAMLERVGVVMLRARDGAVRSVGVRQVRIEYVGRDERYPEPFDRRFDLRLNGEALDWGATYIEYDFRMVNMQLLFTYRNQRPVPEGPYYLWSE